MSGAFGLFSPHLHDAAVRHKSALAAMRNGPHPSQLWDSGIGFRRWGILRCGRLIGLRRRRGRLTGLRRRRRRLWGTGTIFGHCQVFSITPIMMCRSLCSQGFFSEDLSPSRALLCQHRLQEAARPCGQQLESESQRWSCGTSRQPQSRWAGTMQGALRLELNDRASAHGPEEGGHARCVDCSTDSLSLHVGNYLHAVRHHDGASSRQVESEARHVATFAADLVIALVDAVQGHRIWAFTTAPTSFSDRKPFTPCSTVCNLSSKSNSAC